MAQVPYSPVSNVRPDLPATRPVSIASSPTAFGAPQAEALSGLGKVLDTASNELATRANAMQELKNQADARDAASQLANQGSQIYADFRSKQGQDAGPVAFKAYQQQLSDLHDQVAKNLTNPVALNMYNNDAYSTLTRFNMWGATHSGEQLDAYQKTARVAQAEAATNLAVVNPQDRTAWQTARGLASDAVANNLRGQSPEDIQSQQGIAVAKLTDKTIRAMADQGGPGALAAKAMLNDPEYRKALGGDGTLIGPLTKYVQGEEARHGAHTIVDGQFDGSSQFLGSKEIPIDRARYAIGMTESGMNYDIGTPGHMGLTSTNSAGQTGDPLGAYGIMSYNLAPWLKQANMAPMTREQFIANHDAQDQLFDAIYGKDMHDSGSANKAADHWLGPGKSDGLGTTHPEYLTRFNKFLGDKTPPAERVAAGVAHADMLDPDNDELKDNVRNGIETRLTHEDAMARKVDINTINTINTSIQGQVGKGPVTLDALMKDDDFADAYRGMNSTQQKKVQGWIMTAAKQDNVQTDQRTQNSNELMGRAYNGDPKFAQESLLDHDLTADQRSELGKLQKRVIGGEVLQDPMLQAAQKDWDIREKLNQAGITNDKEGKDQWNQFWGAFADETSVARQNGKTLTADDMNQITNGLLQKQDPNAWIMKGSFNYETFTNIPATERQKAVDVLKRQGNTNPSDKEIELIYAKAMYNSVMKAKSNASE